jgi:YesN/AraC family two-component response regulator
MAYLSALAGAIEHSREAPSSEKLKISAAKRLVREHLGEPGLNVKYLAGLLHYSPDYLSHLFHRETGERLIAYIHRERICAALGMLRNTSLSISEVAYALGFDSHAYFCRVFKQLAYKTPSAYRKLVERASVELEGQPKTVYGS